MFDATTDNIQPDRVTRYRLLSNGAPITCEAVLNLWQSNSEFRNFFTTLLCDSPFSGYRWETPAITQSTVDRPFEFVLINSPGFITRPTDTKTYAQYFADDDTDSGVVTFPNLRGDATLVVPSRRGSDKVYGHLAAFVRGAPESQIDSIWRVLGAHVRSLLSSEPIWVSTAGGGVAWLHVRIDSRPKYYGYSPYKTA